MNTAKDLRKLAKSDPKRLWKKLNSIDTNKSNKTDAVKIEDLYEHLKRLSQDEVIEDNSDIDLTKKDPRYQLTIINNNNASDQGVILGNFRMTIIFRNKIGISQGTSCKHPCHLAYLSMLLITISNDTNLIQIQKHQFSSAEPVMNPKANLETIKQEINETPQKVKELAANGCSAEELWLLFKSKLNQSVTNHIPHKIAKQKDSLPWLTPNVRKLIHHRDRLYKKKKKSADPKTTSKLKETKQMVQRDLRRAYWNYTENIVTPKEKNNQYSNMKQFWTYIKHKRTSCVALE
ncbi:unnamed protein product [Mytilus coruscus]|uniref:Uncharacterized protein n=1 Tax=Mytilus coruscus TaxID=42192 RepID=A0A6J8DGV5_MYTCO|nr:unnamed protein product [Mytilus coruscus]